MLLAEHCNLNLTDAAPLRAVESLYFPRRQELARSPYCYLLVRTGSALVGLRSPGFATGSGPNLVEATWPRRGPLSEVAVPVADAPEDRPVCGLGPGSVASARPVPGPGASQPAGSLPLVCQWRWQFAASPREGAFNAALGRGSWHAMQCPLLRAARPPSLTDRPRGLRRVRCSCGLGLLGPPLGSPPATRPRTLQPS